MRNRLVHCATEASTAWRCSECSACSVSVSQPDWMRLNTSPDLTVVLEGRPGGRIFERRPGGQEHDWGEVTIWEPPTRLGYTWHLNRDRSDATDVEIRFLPGDDGATRVEIEHRGWEAPGRSGRGLARPQPRRLGHAAAALRRRSRVAVGRLSELQRT